MKVSFKRYKSISIFSALTSILVLMIFLTGCIKPKEEFITNEFFAMDTWMSVQIAGDFSEEEAENHLKTIESMIRDLENTFSVTLQGSDLYKLNESQNEKVALENEHLTELLTEALQIQSFTDKAFCPVLYKVSYEWGFTTGNYKIPESNLLKSLLSEIADSQATIQENIITRPPGIKFDFGGIAKGYATDCVTEYLKKNSIEKAIVNLGGNIYVCGSKHEDEGWSVGITDPFADRLLGTVEVSDACVVTSGNYERYFEMDGVRYHHIIDGSTGYPADNGLVSVTIISDDASYADALSTALFVMGIDKAIDFWNNNEGFEFIMVTENKEVYYSEALNENVFVSNEEIFNDDYILKPISKDMTN